MKYFLFPGYKVQGFNEEIEKFIEEQGDKAFNIEIDWSSDLVENIDKGRESLENKNLDGKKVFVGHSWGAVVAVKLAEDFEPDYLILCSLSPDFREDYEKMGELSKLGKLKQFLSRKFSSSLEEKPDYPELNSETTFLYGEKEYHGYLGIRSTGYSEIIDFRREKYSNSRHKIIQGAGHRLNKKYIEKLKEEL